MHKRILSTLIILVFLCASLSQPISKGYSATAPPQLDKIFKKAKEKTQEVIRKGKDRLDPKKAANEAIARSLSNAFNDELPLKHDVNSVFPPVHIPEDGFKPKRLMPTVRTLDQELSPGDYEIPVTVYCTKGNVSIPGKGIGYAFTYMQGKQADAMAMLYLRGAIQGVDRSTIQSISWSIQAATPYGQMPREHQQVIDRLIPEYRRQLEGDFLQSFEYKYNTLTRAARGSGIPTFDQVANQAGIFGVRVSDIQREREIIRANALNYQLLEQRLTSGTIEVNEKAPWGEIRPGVYARLKMYGFRGLNWLQFRYVAAAGETITLARVLYGTPRLAPLLGVPVLGEVAIIALMAIPIAQAVQSLAIALRMESRYGDCTEEEHTALQNEVYEACKTVPMSCNPIHDCATLQLHIQRFRRCIAARIAINNTCYGGGNDTHKDEVTNLERGLIYCQGLFSRKCVRR